MSRFELRAVSPLLFLALTAVSATSVAGPVVPPGRAPAQLSNAPRTVGRPVAPVTPVTPPPAPPLGWPHALLTGSNVGCARSPLPNEVIVFRDSDFRGSCGILQPGFYPYADNFLVGNDAISSIKVGSAVRARVFEDGIYSGNWNVYAPGTMSASLGSFNDKISSLRVEPANRRETCDDLQNGEIALYRDQYFRNDCVVLPGDGTFPSAESMGIANDSISSIRNSSAHTLMAFWDPQFSKLGWQMPPHSESPTLPTGGFLTTGIDDNISSIDMSR